MTSSAQLQPEPQSAISQLSAKLADLLETQSNLGRNTLLWSSQCLWLLLRCLWSCKERVSLLSLNIKSLINHEPPCTKQFSWITDSIFCYMLKREWMKKLTEKINNWWLLINTADNISINGSSSDTGELWCFHVSHLFGKKELLLPSLDCGQLSVLGQLAENLEVLLVPTPPVCAAASYVPGDNIFCYFATHYFIYYITIVYHSVLSLVW